MLLPQSTLCAIVIGICFFHHYSREMIFRLSDSPDKVAELQNLVAQHFPKGESLTRSMSIEREFFLLLGPGNSQNVIFSTSNNKLDGKVVATASYKIFDFVLQGAPLKVAAIGLVVTDPEFRRRGLSEGILKAIEDRAAIEGALLSVLWSDLDEFYKKKGYWPAGAELQWDLSSLKSTSAERAASFQIEIITDFKLSEPLYRKQGWGPKRNFADYGPFGTLSDTSVYVCRNYQNNEILAYAAIGKGRDLRGVVHEHGGDNEALYCLLKKVSERQPLARLISPLIPGIEEYFSKKLQLDAMRVGLAYFKIIQLQKFIEFLNLALKNVATLKLKNSQGFEILVSGKVIFESDDITHLLQIFVGPWLPTEMDDLPEELKVALKNWKAEGFYFWGFDSV